MPVNRETLEEAKLYDAFISHSSHDSDVATRLASELEQANFTVWLDKREVLVGHNIVERVDLGISASRFMIVLLSTVSVQSEWVRREWSAAHVAEIESKDVVILPVLVEPCNIPAILQSKKYANLSVWDTGIKDILDAIEGHSSAIIRRAEKLTQVRREIISRPVHFSPTLPSTSLSELFIGGVLFTSIPKTKVRNTSLLIHIGRRINVAINLDHEDAYIMGGISLNDGLKWQWDQDCEAIPCMVLCVDMASGAHSRYILPTYYQVNQLLGRFREVIFLFLLEDNNRTGITGLGIGSLGSELLELRSAHLSYVV